MRAWKIKMMEFQMKKNQKKDEEEEEKKRRMRLRGELPKEEEEEEEDWDPESIHRVCYMNDESGDFLIGTQGQYKGFYYRCGFDSERPKQAYPIEAHLNITYLSFSSFNDLLIVGLSNGEVRLANFNNPDRTLVIKQHDVQTGSIVAAKFSFDERFLLTAGHDGLLFAHVVDKYMIMQEAGFDPLDGVEGTDYMPEEQIKEIVANKKKTFMAENEPNLPEIDAAIDGLDDTMFAVDLRGLPEVPTDITDPSVYSI